MGEGCIHCDRPTEGTPPHQPAAHIWGYSTVPEPNAWEVIFEGPIPDGPHDTTTLETFVASVGMEPLWMQRRPWTEPWTE